MQRGFTLLEVLVALVIIGLGMIAVFTQMNQSLTATAMMRDKTLAYWIGSDRITELRVSGKFPNIGERSDDLDMAGASWRYTIRVSETSVDEFRRVDVDVAFADQPERPVATVTGFLRRRDDPAPPPTNNWAPIELDEALNGNTALTGQLGQ